MLHYARPLDILPSEGYVHMHSHHAHPHHLHLLPHFQPPPPPPQSIHQHHHDDGPRPDTAGSTAPSSASSAGWDPLSPYDDGHHASPPFAYRLPVTSSSTSTITPDHAPPPLSTQSLVLPSSLVAQSANNTGNTGAGGDGGDSADDAAAAAAKTYSFVSLPGNTVKKRPRRRYDEIERLYACNWPACAKAYGTLNHLNAHIVMQRHGPKRTPAEFKELRKQWRKAKKDEAERVARSGGTPLHDVYAHHHHHHQLAQHASLPDLQSQTPLYPSTSYPPPPPPPQQQQQAALYQHQQQQQQHQQGYYFARRHSVADTYAPPAHPPPGSAPSSYPGPTHPLSHAHSPSYPSPPYQHQHPHVHQHQHPHHHQHPNTQQHPHALHHSLSSASLASSSAHASSSHMSLSPPLECADTATSTGAAWQSRAQAQGWDSAQPSYAAAPYGGGGGGGGGASGGGSYDRESPSAGPGSLAPDSTLLAPLSVPGYVAPIAEEAV